MMDPTISINATTLTSLTTTSLDKLGIPCCSSYYDAISQVFEGALPAAYVRGQRGVPGALFYLDGRTLRAAFRTNSDVALLTKQVLYGDPIYQLIFDINPKNSHYIDYNIFSALKKYLNSVGTLSSSSVIPSNSYLLENA